MSRARDLADRVLHNRTHEDTEGGRESIVTFKGEQSGGEISTLAQIQASHDGTADDQKADLIFKTNDGSDNAAPTERLRIDSEGHVGINIVPTNTLVVSETTTPTIQIKDGQASGTRVSGKLHIGEADTLGVSIENSTTSFNDNCAMVFKTSPAAGTLTTRLRIDEHGIKFGSDTAEANGLGDYEEGTWTPIFYSGGTSISYLDQAGRYTKIGRSVQAEFFLRGTITGNGQQLQIGGLPFNNANETLARGWGGAGYESVIGTNSPQFYGGQNLAHFSLYYNGDSSYALANGTTASNQYVIGMFIYDTGS